ncbi:acyl-CoA dehydrogenase family protein [Tianweitania populi]|uniref:Acyl-CoA dehydrogenase/oxidase N-terminal domain-containing protein n=1 Tax=Tianweitania populi TaxID=1607949 RepID=A0A8J3GMX6_9HYPH|nr:acyl-CoA dehydrogenase family protein [Tianweitania populi]GHD23105.1 hypothetical protein GCM10016234_38060 [Tianweitania populi]
MQGSSTKAETKRFADWIETAADAIDRGEEPSSNILPQLAEAGYPAIGVPAALGGSGGDVVDAVNAIADVASHSLASAFVLWSQRAYIQFLLDSQNQGLRERLLSNLLAGRLAGATGLSNAMKFLGGLEPLQISATGSDTLTLNGKMPWVTNLRPEGFHVAGAVDHDDGRVLVVSFAHDDPGMTRTEDLALMGMRSANTAALAINDVQIGDDRIISTNAREWLPKSRPAFAGLQCGMSIGLAKRALSEAKACAGAGRGVLGEPLAQLSRQLDDAHARLAAGLRSQAFVTDASSLFELRIELADIVAQAVQLELQASGGRAYLEEPGRAFARRWREAAFIPIITPSIVQLRTALQQRRDAA